MQQERGVVAYLGPRASYTHQAALKCFPDSTHILEPQLSIDDVFHAVQSGRADRGVVPFENSTNGCVVFTLDLLADLSRRNPDILVCGEAYIDVHHCLLGRARARAPLPPPLSSSSSIANADCAADSPSSSSSGRATPTVDAPHPTTPRAKPLADLRHVRKLYSHPQAWGQCKTFLAAYLKGVERQDVSSTSRAAEVVAQDASGTSAAISSGIAAEVHGLDLLASGIEDSKDNTTRFFVLRKGGEGEVDGEGGRGNGVGVDGVDGVDVDVDGIKAYKTLVAFTVDHEDPGALAESLAVFKPYKLNLTSINARPSGVVPWNYIFFVEFRGKRRRGGQGAVNAALKDLSRVARQWRWLGSWESRLCR